MPVKKRHAIAIGTFALALVTIGLTTIVLSRQNEPKTRDGVYLTKHENPAVKKAYDIAWTRRELMAQLPCHCGCSGYDKDKAHGNVLDCFRTAHAETCTVCVQTAQYADRAATEGRTLEEMRRYLNNVFNFEYFPKESK